MYSKKMSVMNWGKMESMTKRYVTIVTPKGFQRNNFEELYEEFKKYRPVVPSHIVDTPEYRREFLGILEEPDNIIIPNEG